MAGRQYFHNESGLDQTRFQLMLKVSHQKGAWILDYSTDICMLSYNQIASAVTVDRWNCSPLDAWGVWSHDSVCANRFWDCTETAPEKFCIASITLQLAYIMAYPLIIVEMYTHIHGGTAIHISPKLGVEWLSP